MNNIFEEAIKENTNKQYKDTAEVRKQIQIFIFPQLVKLGYDVEFINTGEQKPLHEWKSWSTIDARFYKDGVGLLLWIYPHGDRTHFITVQPTVRESVDAMQNFPRWNNPASILDMYPDPNELKKQTYNFFLATNLYYLIMTQRKTDPMVAFGRYTDHPIDHYKLFYTNEKRKERLDRMGMRTEHQLNEFHKIGIFAVDLKNACNHILV
jgi:hypothetical protein